MCNNCSKISVVQRVQTSVTFKMSSNLALCCLPQTPDGTADSHSSCRAARCTKGSCKFRDCRLQVAQRSIVKSQSFQTTESRYLFQYVSWKLKSLLQSVGTSSLDLATILAVPDSNRFPLHCKLPAPERKYQHKHSSSMLTYTKPFWFHPTDSVGPSHDLLSNYSPWK